MVWLRRCTHYLFIVVVAVNSTLLTINAGDYFLVDNSFYQGTINRNIYVKTSRNVYAYQLLGGGNDTATAGLNFIPPLSCFFQNSVNIPDVNSIGGTAYTADLMVLTYASATLALNGNTISNTLAQSVQGNTDWVTYRISNVSNNITIQSTGPLAVGPKIAAPASNATGAIKDISFSLANTPGEINVSAMLFKLNY